MTHTSPRHRSDDQRSVRRRRPSRRVVTAAALGGVLLSSAAVGAQALVGSTSDEAVASSAEPPVRTESSGTVTRGATRPVLSELDAAADDAAEQVTDAADKAEKKAAAKAKKRKAARKAAAALEAAQKDPRGAAQQMLAEYGWAGQFSCLDALWSGESGWDYTATNPSSGAYGIPQSLPATKMATAGADWRTNPVTQIRWGLDYIRSSYGSPCAAQDFKVGAGYY
jgi:hypothetical protein